MITTLIDCCWIFGVGVVFMATQKRPREWEENSMGIKASEKPVRRSRDVTPISISTPLAQREPPLVHPSAVERIPQAPIEDRSAADLPTTQLVMPKPLLDCTPISEFTRDGKTSYLLHKHMHTHGGYVEYSALLGRDGSGVVWWLDTDWNHGGLSIHMTFEIIANLYAAACDARRKPATPEHPEKEGA